MKFMIIACLLGENCKYDGGNNRNAKVRALSDTMENEIIPICPEVMGGLATPRPPAEVGSDGKVRTKAGKDVTQEYEKGAAIALALAQKEQPDLIILQSRSPSCGVGMRYDGTFTRTKVPKSGVTAELLISHGFKVVDIADLDISAFPHKAL
ncbi:MAG: DUF523 domain-containing protein [Acidaminococcus sp.]|nr:DUF523 domain-containing protein [Acidaminococcus sp.]MCI2100987.1 DUF523 domain-containing protein [Acidaminococcus sp.]MCI2115366.1 DUF523 domain-containing protein [Acidaminococcus sp.]MCI2117462.1 DUF523 domain-containing protein [Acidaminococcus sp.]